MNHTIRELRWCAGEIRKGDGDLESREITIYPHQARWILKMLVDDDSGPQDAGE